MRAKVEVQVHLRPGILDPQGKAIEESLPALGFHGVSAVRVGKSITFEIEGSDMESIEETVARMCSEFLSNPVIEEFTYSVQGVDGAGSPSPGPAEVRSEAPIPAAGDGGMAPPTVPK